MYAASSAPPGQGMNPFADLWRRGVPTGGSSDAHVTPLDPWHRVAAAVHHHRTSQRLRLGGPRCSLSAAGSWPARSGSAAPSSPASGPTWYLRRRRPDRRPGRAGGRRGDLHHGRRPPGPCGPIGSPAGRRSFGGWTTDAQVDSSQTLISARPHPLQRREHPMAKFRVTYATLSFDNEELHAAFEEGAKTARSWVDQTVPTVVNGEAAPTEAVHAPQPQRRQAGAGRGPLGDRARRRRGRHRRRPRPGLVGGPGAERVPSCARPADLIIEPLQRAGA